MLSGRSSSVAEKNTAVIPSYCQRDGAIRQEMNALSSGVQPSATGVIEKPKNMPGSSNEARRQTPIMAHRLLCPRGG